MSKYMITQNDEFQQQWLALAKKDAEENTYCAEILKQVLSIIDNKDYSHLYCMMESYDRVVKMYDELKFGIKYKYEEYPFWCYGFASSDELLKDLQNGFEPKEEEK